MKWMIAAGIALALSLCAAQAAAPKDLSNVRGFNYTPASVTNEQLYLQYNDAEVNRDFGYARSLNLNQARVFLRYNEWSRDTPKFRDSFKKLLAAVKRHDLQIMFVLVPARDMIDLPAGASAADTDKRLTDWLGDVLGMAKGHSEVLAWDVANEPDWSGYSDNPMPDSYRQNRLAMARKIADFVHKFDKSNLTTIGCFREKCLEEMAAYTDILSYHDYSPTRAEIDTYIDRAKAFAAKVGKPLVQTEVGCIGRGNPYDMALREYKKAGVGTYIWELMITKGWGDIHGVFYPDGTVRDPAIAAAVMGIFRNEGDDRRLENPDRESWVSKPLQRSAQWLANANPDWKEGLEIAEIDANMLEGNQLVAMRFPPTLTVKKLREGAPNLPALRAAMQDYVSLLTPYAGMGRQHGN